MFHTSDVSHFITGFAWANRYAWAAHELHVNCRSEPTLHRTCVDQLPRKNMTWCILMYNGYGFGLSQSFTVCTTGTILFVWKLLDLDNIRFIFSILGYFRFFKWSFIQDLLQICHTSLHRHRPIRPIRHLGFTVSPCFTMVPFAEAHLRFGHLLENLPLLLMWSDYCWCMLMWSHMTHMTHVILIYFDMILWFRTRCHEVSSSSSSSISSSSPSSKSSWPRVQLGSAQPGKSETHNLLVERRNGLILLCLGTKPSCDQHQMFQPVILSPYPQTNILSSAPRHLQLQVLHRLPEKEDLCQGNQRTRHVLA